MSKTTIAIFKDDPMHYLLKRFLRYLGIASALILLFVLLGYGFRFQSLLAFITIAGAYFLAGIFLGFLFGMPRSEKFRYKSNNSSGEAGQNTSWYTDNTNLEDVSDWLTKIIIGLSLVNFEKILSYTDKSAKNIAISLTGEANQFTAYSLSYGIIILFTTAGFIISYLWAFTILRTLLIKRKKEDQKEIDPIVVNQSSEGSKEAVNNLPNAFLDDQPPTVTINDGDTTATTENKNEIESFENFKAKVHEELEKRKVKDATDLQKNRWGGIKTKNGKEVTPFIKETANSKLFDLWLRVASVNANKLTGWVAFFVHDTFGFAKDVVYAKCNNDGFAEIRLITYEAFTVGVLCEDGTDLEIDLNEENGFPPGFYWK